jgi:rare lipoprotein A
MAACSRGYDAPTPSVAVRKAPPARTSAVSDPRETSAPFREPSPPRTVSTAGGYKLGKPYRIGNVWYVPREEPDYERTGTGSWYGANVDGHLTANGETFNMNALTAAHPTLPLPSYVTVTNEANGRMILVRVNDRGPYVPGRIVDLSRAAARALGYEHLGTATLTVRYVGRAPLNGDTARERDYLAAQPWSRAMATNEPSPAARPKAGTRAWSLPWGLGGDF